MRERALKSFLAGLAGRGFVDFIGESMRIHSIEQRLQKIDQMINIIIYMIIFPVYVIKEEAAAALCNMRGHPAADPNSGHRPMHRKEKS
jgi:hypothetical protein